MHKEYQRGPQTVAQKINISGIALVCSARQCCTKARPSNVADIAADVFVIVIVVVDCCPRLSSMSSSLPQFSTWLTQHRFIAPTALPLPPNKYARLSYDNLKYDQRDVGQHARTCVVREYAFAKCLAMLRNTNNVRFCRFGRRRTTHNVGTCVFGRW